jgi:uncharacterized lipoprotein YajG
MFKVIPIVFAVLLLAGCQTTQTVVKTKLTVVMPDSALYNCPVIKNLPNTNGLTDAKVARLILELYKNNITCANSIEAIQKFLEEAQKTIEAD